MLSPQILSSNELESRLKNLVQRERQLLHIILEYIKELDARKLYLERAYSSLFEYLTKELGYSGSAAMRRIEAARLLREVPLVAEKIQDGTLNLSQIGELSRSIKEKESTTGVKVSALQKENLLEKIIGRTTLETQKELAVALDIPVKEFEKQKMQKDESVRLELTLSKDQYQKLQSCRDLAAHLLGQKQSGSSWASVFEVLADQYLAKKNLTMKKQKKIEMKCQVDLKTALNIALNTDLKEDLQADLKPDLQSDLTSPSTAEITVSKQEKKQAIDLKRKLNKSTLAIAASAIRNNRTLTMKTRKIILQRDRCCQYKDPRTGRQCRSTYGLQIDHLISQWAGGTHEFKNLQVLCGQHNRFKYRKEANLSSSGLSASLKPK